MSLASNTSQHTQTMLTSVLRATNNSRTSCVEKEVTKLPAIYAALTTHTAMNTLVEKTAPSWMSVVMQEDEQEFTRNCWQCVDSNTEILCYNIPYRESSDIIYRQRRSTILSIFQFVDQVRPMSPRKVNVTS